MKKKVFLHIISIAFMVIVLSLSLFFIRTSFLGDATTKTKGYFINDIFDAPSQPLKSKDAPIQKFSTKENIYGIKVRFHNNGVPQAGTIIVEIIEESKGTVVLSKVANSETLLNDAYSAINFDSPYIPEEKTDFYIKITPSFEKQDAEMAIWQNSATGDWAFGLNTYIVSDFIYSWFNLLSVLVVLGAVLIYLACFVFKMKKETTFIICLCTVSVLFNFVLPPYSSPDEEAHINSAYRLSNQLFDGRAKEDFATPTIYKRGSDYNKIFEDKLTSVFSYEYVYENFFKASQDKELVPQEESWLVGDFPAVYGLGAVAIKLGRILNLGYVPLLYLGRLFNLAFFALCGYLAIKLAPIGKEIFMILSFLPITLHLTNSFSRDAFVISIAFLFIAYLLNLLYKKEKCSVIDIGSLLLLCLLLAPSKMIYAPICGLVLLLGKGKINITTQGKIKQSYLVIAAGIIIAVAFIATNSGVISYALQAFSNTTPLEQLLISSPDQTFNIGIMLQNPMVTLKLVLNTIFSNLAYYIKSLTGGVLGYNSIAISEVFSYIFLVLTILSTFKAQGEEIRLKTVQRVSFLSVFMIIFALVVYVGISWTPISYTTIYGIQGKYLLPALPLLLLALKNNTLTITKDLFKPLCFVAATANIFVCLNAFVIIIQR